MKKITNLLVVAFVMLFSELSAQEEIQRVYLDFETETGFQREILLGFTPDNAATDGFDYGYDGGSFYNYPNDIGWMIEGERYVIQGVGAFDSSKTYPLGIFLTNNISISINLQTTENFEEPISVYIYDSWNDQYYNITNSSFEESLTSGTYEDRYYVAFQDNLQQNLLSNEDHDLTNLEIKYSRQNNELLFKSSGISSINTIEAYSILGKKLSAQFIKKNGVLSLKIPNITGHVLLLRISTNKGTVLKKVYIK